MIRIYAKDLYYLPRVENLEREYEKIEIHMKELEDEFDKSIYYETISTPLLNVISDRMQTCTLLMSAIKLEIKRLHLEICN